MKWTYGIRNKYRAALILAVILIIALLFNLMNRQNFQKLDQSMHTMFEDRLMAENYLFHLYANLNNKTRLLQRGQSTGWTAKLETDLAEYQKVDRKLLDQYRATYLTEEETKQFRSLEHHLSRISLLEQQLMDIEHQMAIPDRLLLQHGAETARAFSALSSLTDLQTAVGSEIREQSKRIVTGTISVSWLEITLLIILGILIQGLIFSSRSMEVRHPKAHLN